MLIENGGSFFVGFLYSDIIKMAEFFINCHVNTCL